jgi:hypothetical protein
VVDGRVLRGPDGKELRCPILLTAFEKEIARKLTQVFKQNICGFDLLRTQVRLRMSAVVNVRRPRSFCRKANSHIVFALHRHCPWLWTVGQQVVCLRRQWLELRQAQRSLL